jgi:hypothetical protein
VSRPTWPVNLPGTVPTGAGTREDKPEQDGLVRLWSLPVKEFPTSRHFLEESVEVERLE